MLLGAGDEHLSAAAARAVQLVALHSAAAAAQIYPDTPARTDGLEAATRLLSQLCTKAAVLERLEGRPAAELLASTLTLTANLAKMASSQLAIAAAEPNTGTGADAADCAAEMLSALAHVLVAVPWIARQRAGQVAGQPLPPLEANGAAAVVTGIALLLDALPEHLYLLADVYTSCGLVEFALRTASPAQRAALARTLVGRGAALLAAAEEADGPDTLPRELLAAISGVAGPLAAVLEAAVNAASEAPVQADAAGAAHIDGLQLRCAALSRLLLMS